MSDQSFNTLQGFHFGTQHTDSEDVRSSYKKVTSLEIKHERDLVAYPTEFTTLF